MTSFYLAYLECPQDQRKTLGIFATALEAYRFAIKAEIRAHDEYTIEKHSDYYSCYIMANNMTTMEECEELVSELETARQKMRREEEEEGYQFHVEHVVLNPSMTQHERKVEYDILCELA